MAEMFEVVGETTDRCVSSGCVSPRCPDHGARPGSPGNPIRVPVDDFVQRAIRSTPPNRDPRVEQARAYVTSRFYPALPPIYGDLAVQALDALVEDQEDAAVTLPADLNPLPKDAFEIEGEMRVMALDLIRALRLEHMLEEED